MTSEILNLGSTIRNILDSTSQITTSLLMNSALATTLNSGSDINTSMTLSSLIELEEA